MLQSVIWSVGYFTEPPLITTTACNGDSRHNISKNSSIMLETVDWTNDSQRKEFEEALQKHRES